MFLFYPSQRSVAETWNYVMFLYTLVTSGISKASCSDASKGTVLQVALGLAILWPLEELELTISLESLGCGVERVAGVDRNRG
jgi:hypothetical protein